MKLFKLLICLTVLGMLQSCNDEDPTKQSDMIRVQFSSNLPSFSNDGRILNEEEPTHLLITIETLAGGGPVLALEKIDLYKIGGSYISEPIALETGTYKVEDFLMVNESNEVVYAVPKYGSALEKAVSKPLPFQFYVGKDVALQYDLEVISTAGYEADDLGYASFKGQVVNPLRVAVFTADDPALPTDALASVLQGGDTIKQFSLQPKINLISFPGEKDADYSIVVEKAGYATYVKDFNYSQLVDSLDNLLLEVMLQKSFTFLAYTSDLSFEFSLEGESGTLFIDFGDGTSTTHLLSMVTGDARISHTYPSAGNYPVTITGDIDLIEEFYSYYNQAMIDQIDFTGLTGLKEIRFGLTRCPAVVDLSNCHQLNFVNMAGMNQMEDLILPDVSFIKSIYISGPNLLNTADVDDIIDKVHHSAVLHNIVNGLFVYRRDWLSTSGDLVGPPSAASTAKLTELRDTYNWSIVPQL